LNDLRRHPVDKGSSQFFRHLSDEPFHVRESFRFLDARKNLVENGEASSFFQAIKQTTNRIQPPEIGFIRFRWSRTHRPVAKQQPVEVDSGLADGDQGFSARNIHIVLVLAKNSNMQSYLYGELLLSKPEVFPPPPDTF
jgi:hypothetical protein